MKVCILTPRFPFPENGGDVLRINNIARYLVSKGHSIVLVSFVDKINSPQNFIEAKSLYKSIYIVERRNLSSAFYSFLFLLCLKPIQCGYYFSFSFEKEFHKAINIEKPDLFISHLLRMTPYLLRLGLVKQSIIEMTDALSKTYTIANCSKVGTIKKILYGIEKGLIKKYENHIINKFPKVVLVSKEDISYLKYNCADANTNLVLHTNGIDSNNGINPNYNRKKISFVGNMRTLQNQDAVVRFVNQIFPLILNEIPDVVFYIIGAQPPKYIKDMENEHIVVTGYVDNIEQELSDSCITVAPVFVASGIQNKVLVSMACGVPVIMSSLISKAIPELINYNNCIIEDSPDKFAK